MKFFNTDSKLKRENIELKKKVASLEAKVTKRSRYVLQLLKKIEELKGK